VFDGGNPNVSILLGVREVEDNNQGSNTSGEGRLLSVEDRLDIVRKQLEEVDKVQDQVTRISLKRWNSLIAIQVKTLRKRIADTYAEKLADNMTSCVTQ